MKYNKIYQGNALNILKKFPKGCIDMGMTSPPYWALRDYGVKGQIGLEETFDEYINNLCDIFDEVKRVLKDTGTIWVNMGDTFFGGGQDDKNYGGKETTPETAYPKIAKGNNYSTKCLCLIPNRFAIEMVNRGWILRNTIIWQKPNCMPSPAKDRFTVDFEYMFLFSKQKKYYFESQHEPLKYNEKRPFGITREREFGYDTQYPEVRGYKNKSGNGKVPNNTEQRHGADIRRKAPTTNKKNKRSVWLISSQQFEGAHFATYPEELCQTPIKAGCPEFVCKKCGKAKEKIFQSSLIPTKKAAKRNIIDDRDILADKKDQGSNRQKSNHIPGLMKIDKHIGWKECDCKAGFEGGIVLDPFIGSGTTALVTLKQNKRFVGIEINKEYINIANKRIKPWLDQTRIKDF